MAFLIKLNIIYVKYLTINCTKTLTVLIQEWNNVYEGFPTFP